VGTSSFDHPELKILTDDTTCVISDRQAWLVLPSAPDRRGDGQAATLTPYARGAARYYLANLGQAPLLLAVGLLDAQVDGVGAISS